MDLTFSVTNQNLTRTDNNVVVADSKNYLHARFSFLTEDWDGLTKTAVFKYGNKTYNALLDETGECVVPWEVLTGTQFSVSVFGGDLITTGVVNVRVAESGYASGSASMERRPDVYAQITGTLSAINAKLDTISTAIEDLTTRVEALEGAHS